MVMEFDDLKVLVEKAVVDRGDHATLLWTEDPVATGIARMQAAAPEKLVRLPRKPTAELLARESWPYQGLPSGIVPERAVLSERPTCSAEISCDRA